MNRLIIFDLDGTLVDSRESILRSVRYALTQLNLDKLELNELHCLQQDLATTFRGAFEKSGQPVDEEKLHHFIRIYREHHSLEPGKAMRPYEEIPDLLNALRKEDFKLAVATTKHSEQAEQVLNSLGLRRFFDFVQGTDLGMRYKPAPDILYAVLSKLEMESGESAYVGDSSHDMKAARAAEMTAIGAAYGFGGREALEEGGPHAWLERPSDLLDLFELGWYRWQDRGGHSVRLVRSQQPLPSAKRGRSAVTAAQIAIHAASSSPSRESST